MFLSTESIRALATVTDSEEEMNRKVETKVRLIPSHAEKSVSSRATSTDVPPQT